MRELVVVIAPPALSIMDKIRKIAADWSAAGFLRTFVWWDGEDAGQHHAVWSDGSSGPQPLLDVLAGAPYGRVRLVSLLPFAEHPPEDMSDLPGVAQAVEDTVTRHLAKAQRLHKVGLVVPATGVSSVPSTLLSNRWDSTVVVVDEDSVDPAYASREIRYPDHFAEHTMLALATTGGLWTGMDGAPFDGDTEAAGQQEPRVRLIRCHARGARSYGLPDDIVRETLTCRQNPAWAAIMAGAVPAKDGDYLAERTAVEYLDGPGQRLRHDPFVPPPRRIIRIGPRLAFRLLWLFMLGRTRELRQELRIRAANELYDRVERFTQRVVFGDGTDFVVRFDDRPLGEAGGSPDTELVGLAEALVEATDRPSAPRTFAEEWRTLRDLAFGLADGGPIPVDFTEPTSGVRRELVAARSVSPAPSQLAGESTEEDQPAAGTLVGRIGQRLESDVDTARRAFLGAIERLKRSLPGKPAQAEVDRRYWYCWLALTAITLTGLIVAITLLVKGKVPVDTGLYAAGSAVAGFAVGTTVILALYLRKEFQAANRANRIWQEYEEARLEAEHEAEELIRLTAAVEEYRDWAPILARMLYLAGREAVVTPPDGTDLATLSRPSAFGVGATETNPKLLDRLASIIGRQCFRAGWISALYTRVLEQSMADLKFRRGLPAGSANPDPDTEASARRELRALLCDDGVADTELIANIRAIVARQTGDLPLGELFCAVHPVGGLPVPPEKFLSALQDTSGEKAARFNRRLWDHASGYPGVGTATRTWLPDRLAAELAITPTATFSVTLVPSASVITVQAARLDLTEPIVWSDLALFGPGKAETEQPPEPPPDGGDDW
jgi:hypothetical protein